MAWVKIPKENHPLFHAALPRDPRVSTVNMFGGVAAKANGQTFAGLFARGAVVKLRAWVSKALAHTTTLPAKASAAAAKRPPAKRPPAKAKPRKKK